MAREESLQTGSYHESKGKTAALRPRSKLCRNLGLASALLAVFLSWAAMQPKPRSAYLHERCNEHFPLREELVVATPGASEEGGAAGSSGAEKEFDLVLLGATGFTGRLVAEYLASTAEARDGSVRWALAGRSEARLGALRDALRPAGLKVLMGLRERDSTGVVLTRPIIANGPRVFQEITYLAIRLPSFLPIRTRLPT